ncbi:unnamed protein product, partial [Mesorhabditis spiculigera]
MGRTNAQSLFQFNSLRNNYYLSFVYGLFVGLLFFYYIFGRQNQYPYQLQGHPLILPRTSDPYELSPRGWTPAEVFVENIVSIFSLSPQNRKILSSQISKLNASELTNAVDIFRRLCPSKIDCQLEPPFLNIDSQYKVARPYALAACTIYKNMSTVLIAIMCYLHDMEKSLNSTVRFFDQWDELRPCLRSNEAPSWARSMERIGLDIDNITKFTLVREPMEKFMSAYVQQCLLWMKCEACHDPDCLLDKLLGYAKTFRLKGIYGAQGMTRSHLNAHFLPQNWRCEFGTMLDEYVMIRYSSADIQRLLFDFQVLLKSAKVEQDKIDFVKEKLASGQCAKNSTKFTAEELKAYDAYLKQYEKSYTTAEKNRRIKFFLHAQKKINNWNKKQKTQEFAHNTFSDWSPKELKRLLAPKNWTEEAGPIELFRVANTSTAPSSSSMAYGANQTKIFVDWRRQGVVTPVKNQGKCGCCYAFAAVAAVESAFALKGQTLQNLSVQEIVNCVQGGCKGGAPYKVYQYIKINGILDEATAPFLGKRKTCTNETTNSIIGSAPALRGEAELEDFVNNTGPASVCFKAPMSFVRYSNGTYQPTEAECNATSNAHCVVVIGHGVELGLPYWIFKNSWGVRWGEDGYGRFVKGQNACGFERRSVNGPLLATS